MRQRIVGYHSFFFCLAIITVVANADNAHPILNTIYFQKGYEGFEGYEGYEGYGN